jgi:predicted cation transporter
LLMTSELIPAEPVFYITAGLVIVTLMVLVLPFWVRIIEHNLEIFFLIMGVLSVTVSGLWSWGLIVEALKAPVVVGTIPVGIFQVVLIFGILLFYFNKHFSRLVHLLIGKLSLRLFAFFFVLILGLISSIISVIVTSVLLAEIVAVLPLDKSSRTKLVIITCFAVGLGAVLTPLGEPLSTILVQKLAGPPYNAGFSFTFEVFSIYVIPGIILLAALAAIVTGKQGKIQAKHDTEGYTETLRNVIFRSIKVFAFVAALILLGEGLKPLVVWYIIKIPSVALYWINILSAVLDNATLTAVEITASMSLSQITSIIMGLLIAGGMLIPGNIPNIVAAGRLKINMKEWAVVGIPLGLVLLVVYFIALLPILIK